MIKTRKSQGINCHQCPVSLLCLPCDLGNMEVNIVDELISKVRYIPKKDHLFHANSPLQNLYAVYKGSCKEYWINEDGNECVTNFYFPGDIIGIESLASCKHMFSVTSLEDAELCVIPIHSFLEAMQVHPAILKRFFNITSLKMQNDQSTRMSVTANERVCDFLLNIVFRMRERNPQEKEIVLPMSQLDISNFVGIAYETVNRIFKNLKKQKIIQMRNKTLTVLNLTELENIAHSNYFTKKN